MCFNTTKYMKARIAKEDIICYKKGLNFDEKTGVFIPYYKHFKYGVDITQPTVKLKKEERDVYDNDYVIHEGYHSYMDKSSCSDYLPCGEFIIPKGTRYYKSIRDGEYVSETIIFKRILN